jgi:hypothetical protein
VKNHGLCERREEEKGLPERDQQAKEGGAEWLQDVQSILTPVGVDTPSGSQELLSTETRWINFGLNQLVHLFSCFLNLVFRALMIPRLSKVFITES